MEALQLVYASPELLHEYNENFYKNKRKIL